MADAAIAEPRITVVFLLYNAARDVEQLVERLLAQRHPDGSPQPSWLRAVFVDDASADSTAEVLRESLRRRDDPGHVRPLLNPRNLGLAGTLNRVLAEVDTAYVLTCHCDCLFAGDDYVATALALLERHPDAGAISGQPRLMPGRRLPFAEMLNHVTNLMDILPREDAAPLEPVGFAEGRCDAFRMAALREVGFYKLALRTAGEDQLLAADLRRAGYGVYKSARLTYYLLASNEQNTVSKLLRHQRLFGRVHPYILLRQRGAVAGVWGRRAGGNRSARALLRASQLVAAPLYPLALVAGWLPAARWSWWALAAVLALRGALLLRHLRLVRPSPTQSLAILALQPPLDLAYTAGVVSGIGRLALGGSDQPLA